MAIFLCVFFIVSIVSSPKAKKVENNISELIKGDKRAVIIGVALHKSIIKSIMSQ